MGFKFTIVLAIIVVVLASLLLLAKPQQTSTQITTSFYPLYFFTKEIVGSTFKVTNITPSGSEPHDYEPTIRDIATIENSKLLILQGGSFEAWGNRIKTTLAEQGIVIDAVGEHLMTQDTTDETGTKLKDPHTWLSPALAKQEAEAILRDVIAIAPADKDQFQSNAQHLLQQLDTLEQEYRNGLAACKFHDIITSHAAFGYLTQEFGLHQIAIAGLTPDTEPNVRDMANITRFAKDHDIHYIFFESLVSPKLSQTIAREIGAQTVVLNPLEGLTTEEVQQGKTYFTVMRDNLATLRTALQCQ